MENPAIPKRSTRARGSDESTNQLPLDDDEPIGFRTRAKRPRAETVPRKKASSACASSCSKNIIDQLMQPKAADAGVKTAAKSEEAWEWMPEFDIAPPPPMDEAVSMESAAPISFSDVDEMYLGLDLDIPPPPPPDTPAPQEEDSLVHTPERRTPKSRTITPDEKDLPIEPAAEKASSSTEEPQRRRDCSEPLRTCGKPPEPQTAVASKLPESAVDDLVPAPGTPPGRRDPKWTQDVDRVAPPTAEKPKSPARRRATNPVDVQNMGKTAAVSSSLKPGEGFGELVLSARATGESFLDAKDAQRQEAILAQLAKWMPVFIAKQSAIPGAIEPHTPPEKRQKLEFSNMVSQATAGCRFRSGIGIQPRKISFGNERALHARPRARDFDLQGGRLHVDAEMQ